MTRVRQARHVSPRAVITGAAVLLVAIMLAATLGRLYERHLNPLGRLGVPTPTTPEATLPLSESDPQSERTRFDAEKQAVLKGWGWVDKRAGVAHIPVERAMALMAETPPEPAR